MDQTQNTRELTKLNPFLGWLPKKPNCDTLPRPACSFALRCLSRDLNKVGSKLSSYPGGNWSRHRGNKQMQSSRSRNVFIVYLRNSKTVRVARARVKEEM